MSTRRTRQDLARSPQHIFMVCLGVLNAPVLSFIMTYRVPKELIAQFVKACPTCQKRRNPSRADSYGQASRKLSGSDSMMDFIDSAASSRESSPVPKTEDTWTSLDQGGVHRAPTNQKRDNADSFDHYDQYYDTRNKKYLRPSDIGGHFNSAPEHCQFVGVQNVPEEYLTNYHAPTHQHMASSSFHPNKYEQTESPY